MDLQREREGRRERLIRLEVVEEVVFEGRRVRRRRRPGGGLVRGGRLMLVPRAVLTLGRSTRRHLQLPLLGLSAATSSAAGAAAAAGSAASAPGACSRTPRG